MKFILLISTLIIGICQLHAEEPTPQPVQAPLPTLYPYGGPSMQEVYALGNPYKNKREFLTRLQSVYCNPAAAEPWLEATSRGLKINGQLIPWNTKAKKKTWRSLSELPPLRNIDKPLEGMRIGIDPGHIGGVWAYMEKRDNIISDKFRVCEGNSTRIVARILANNLSRLGATVFVVRTLNKPVTHVRPDDILKKLQTLPETAPIPPDQLRNTAEQLFIRRAELNARAAAFRQFKPDIILCLHFDAGATSAPVNKFHIILNGSYTQSELNDIELRQSLYAKLLSKTYDTEVAISSCIAKHIAAALNLPAHNYGEATETVRPVAGEPYLWCRNLIANCLYPSPVIYLEPYAMNHEITARRMTIGDYDGELIFSGTSYPSIYRAYANAVTDGLRAYYAHNRRKAN